MPEQQNIPQLRFPEFGKEWEVKSLGRIASFFKGKGVSKTDIAEDGAIECIRYGELYTEYKETIDKVVSKTNLPEEDLVLSEENDVIIPASGETQIDIATASCVLRSGIALGGDLNIIRTSTNGVFLAYYLNNKRKFEIAKLSQGSSVVHLYPSQLKLLHIFIPQPEEQQKIASFLTAVDAKIEQLTQKKNLLEQYKKGVMQQIFSQEIRFKDDEGNNYPDWTISALGEHCSVSMCKRIFSEQTSESGEVPFYKIGTIGGDADSYISRNLFEEYKSKYKFPEKGEVLVTCSGTVGKCVPYDGRDAYFQDSNIVWLSNPTLAIRNDFLYYILANYDWGKLNSTTITRIYGSDLRRLQINYPKSKYEQTKIANFLSAIDAKIELVGGQLEKTQGFKKGLLQRMFV